MTKYRMTQASLFLALSATTLMCASLNAHAFGSEEDRIQTPLHSEFKKLDRNNDGKLSRQESGRDQDVGPNFTKADLDNNDSLSPDEYSTFKSSMQQARVESFLDDSSVTAKVKAELLKDDGIKSLAIKVQTHHGRPRQRGSVGACRSLACHGAVLG